MRFSDYLTNRLLQAGMSRVFLVTGGGAMHLNDALSRNSQMRVTCFHHEQAAAIAAEGFTRMSGVPCVLNVTTGPGGLNALVGVFGAYVDSVPMFVVSGQVKRETCMSSFPDLALRQLGDQEAPVATIVKSIVKYVRSVSSVPEAVAALERALHLMRSGRPGPVWLDIPIDIQAARVDESELRDLAAQERAGELESRLGQDPGCHPNTLLEFEYQSRQSDHTLVLQVHEVHRRMREARRPVVLVGNGIHTNQAKALWARLLNSISCPVVTGWNALDLLPTDHPNFVGRPGTVGDRGGNFVVQSADFLLVIGCRLNIRQLSYNWKSFAKNAFIAMVDIDPAELDKPTLKLSLKIRAASEVFLDLLLQGMSGPSPDAHGAFLNRARKLAQEYSVAPLVAQSDNMLNPYWFLQQLTDSLPKEATVVTGNGAACVMTFQVAVVKSQQRYITNSGCASMGYDLPAAIGAALAMPNRAPVICIAGDGSIMMNLQELQTLRSTGLNIKIVILNNGGYLSIRQTQQSYFSDNLFGTGGGNGLDMPDFRKIASAFGIEYHALTTPDDLRSATFATLINADGPVLFEAFVNPDQGFSPKLASRVNNDGSMSSPELDDMAPFIDREKLEQARSSLLSYD